jgi:hypothetical protein
MQYVVVQSIHARLGHNAIDCSTRFSFPAFYSGMFNQRFIVLPCRDCLSQDKVTNVDVLEESLCFLCSPALLTAFLQLPDVLFLISNVPNHMPAR